MFFRRNSFPICTNTIFPLLHKITYRRYRVVVIYLGGIENYEAWEGLLCCIVHVHDMKKQIDMGRLGVEVTGNNR